jgi:hypothetical protein
MVTNDNKMITKSREKSRKIFSCAVCDYTTTKPSDFKKHLSTDKHNDNQMVTKVAKSRAKYFHARFVTIQRLNQVILKNIYQPINTMITKW